MLFPYFGAIAYDEAMLRLGVAEEPNSIRNAYKCLKKPVDAMSKWASAGSALTRAFSVCLGDGATLLATTKDFKNIQEWKQEWSCTRELLDHAGVDSLSELVHVSGDASDGVNVSSGRDFEGGYRYVPRDTAVPDGHGGFKHKPKKARTGTGNGPTRFTCHHCGHAWNPDADAILSDGTTRCVCNVYVAPPP